MRQMAKQTITRVSIAGFYAVGASGGGISMLIKDKRYTEAKTIGCYAVIVSRREDAINSSS
jgi:hypothetical protein